MILNRVLIGSKPEISTWIFFTEKGLNKKRKRPVKNNNKQTKTKQNPMDPGIELDSTRLGC